MSKTISIDNHIIDVRMFADFCAHDLLADGVTIAANALDQHGVPRGRWLAASLIAMIESGAYILTPRGTDLRASLPQLLAETKPEPAVKHCSKCNGTGKQPLFVSMETCDRCKGSKGEPRFTGIDFNTLVKAFDDVLKPTYEIQVTGGRTGSKHPNALPRVGCSAFMYPTANGNITERMSEHPWVLIDSLDVAESFVGKRVQIDAPAGGPIYSAAAGAHGETVTIKRVCSDGLCTTSGGVDWQSRGNVRLRLVEGDPS
jgi:hypothetical protein